MCTANLDVYIYIYIKDRCGTPYKDISPFPLDIYIFVYWSLAFDAIH